MDDSRRRDCRSAVTRHAVREFIAVVDLGDLLGRGQVHRIGEDVDAMGRLRTGRAVDHEDDVPLALVTLVEPGGPDCGVANCLPSAGKTLTSTFALYEFVVATRAAGSARQSHITLHGQSHSRSES